MSLVELGWRRFTFFDRELVPDPENPVQPFLGLQDLDCVGCCSGRGFAIFGESTGGIFILSKQLQIDYWKAYPISLAHICLVPQHHILVSIGRQDTEDGSTIKVWDLDRFATNGIDRFCSRITRTFSQNRSSEATCVAVHSSLFFMAVGFDDSTVLVYRGEVTKAKSSRGEAKAQTVRAASAAEGAVCGLAFHMLSDKRLVLFVTTASAVLSYVFREKDVEKVNVHDARGSAKNCSAMGGMALDFQFVVARTDMVYFYNAEQCASGEDASSGKCHGFERDKEKALAKVFDSYLLIVTKEVSGIEAANDQKMNMITIYDIPGQYIAYNAPIAEVVDVFFEWGAVYVLCANGKLFKLVEKEIRAKLDVLFRKNLFDVAIGLAKRHFCDNENLAEIFKQHGDYLYEKSDFENAVKEYTHTIGTIEPSYVIRKFLDAQRIKQLAQYLEVLHKRGLATADHTTILINCFTKLNDRQKIDAFIDSSENELNFDIDTAIKVLRSANFIDQSLRLAAAHGHHDMYLHTQLEDKKDFARAVEYIAALPFQDAERYLKKYGKTLLRELPSETTLLLTQLCTGFTSQDDALPQKASATEFIHIFLDDSMRLCQFLEHMTQDDADAPSTLFNTLLELYLREYSASESAEKSEQIMTFLRSATSKYELDQALVLCQMHNFGDGTLFLYEKGKLHQQILQHHMNARDYESVIETCRKFGRESKEMWIEALWFFARNDDAPAAALGQLLRHVEQQQLLPPLMVLEILSHSHTVTLGVVKEYLVTWLKKENEKTERDDKLIQQYKEQIEKTECVIDDLRNKPQLFQVSKCSACDTPLEVPTVHFLCKHSYHQHCFDSYADADAECPACAPENKRLRAQLNALERSNKDTYQQFRAELQASNDSIATIAEHFGRGLFRQKCAASVANSQAAPSNNPFEED